MKLIVLINYDYALFTNSFELTRIEIQKLPLMKHQPIHIVFLGGGYVSIWAYRSLVTHLHKEITNGLVELTVISPEDHHYFHGWTAESLTCIVRDQNRMSPLNEVMPLAEIIHGWANGIDTDRNLVSIQMKDGSIRLIAFDHLVIGIGSIDNEGIEGVKTYGYSVKSHVEFLRTKAAIQEIVRKAATVDEISARNLLSIVVAGAGFTGVELVTNIAEFITVIKKPYSSLKYIQPRVSLISSGEKILNILDPGLSSMRKYAEKILDQCGIQVFYQSRIKRVSDQGARLDDGTFIPAELVISTVGQCRQILHGTENLEKDELNRLFTNGYLQLKDSSNIWGGGDACQVTHPKTGTACPANALWAIKHGEHIGKNIARTIKSKELLSFKFRGLGQCASLGIGKGMGELYGMVFTGWIAWIMRWFFFDYFMPSRRVMLAMVTDWLHLIFHGRRRSLAMQEENTDLSLNNSIEPNPFSMPMGI
ncbi:MAG: NAD(P)/FAD-dependent oxidoreductase [Chitinophagales bacterium]